VFWGAEMTARFRDVNLTDVTISHGLLVDIDAWIDNVVINGVVTDYVNEREWYPLRTMLRPDASAAGDERSDRIRPFAHR
jgi:hypothetical protein